MHAVTLRNVWTFVNLFMFLHHSSYRCFWPRMIIGVYCSRDYSALTTIRLIIAHQIISLWRAKRMEWRISFPPKTRENFDGNGSMRAIIHNLLIDSYPTFLPGLWNARASPSLSKPSNFLLSRTSRIGAWQQNHRRRPLEESGLPRECLKRSMAMADKTPPSAQLQNRIVQEFRCCSRIQKRENLRILL